ncbi:MAG TPA: single-stranded-DNA-specific exonuclease RecJ [Syntrophaceae bacterium]|jgi:single-stranded-DNA-specific exonuclease|nr:single-stranded-DNA-specific exonuclease RecJ [Syntrophaceae bacterium]
MKTLRLPTTQWKISKGNRDVEDLLAKELQVHHIISRILTSRHILNTEDANRYLSPSLNDLHNPLLMKDMQKGVQRLTGAIYNHEKTVIYGDYDADGVTSVVVLLKFLMEINHSVSYYIPDRIKEGYGLNKPSIDKMKADNVKLIVTVDCGISDHEHISYARALGIDTIILDHHEVPGILPEAVAIINQNRKDCTFPFKDLAAVGIVFNFLIALRGKLRKDGFWESRKYPNLREYLDLVALGTIGDICPLINENRIFTKIGLDLITEGRRVGLRALMEICGIDSQVIDTGKASFCLIPRINAAGRIASASEAVQLLLTDDIEEARRIAYNLELYNRKRQTMERDILNEILEEIEKTTDTDKVKSLVFASYKWHPGVIGIVASKLVDRYYRPTILISLKDGVGKGSGRSIADFNIYKGLKECDSLLLSYGGHRYAAGISIKEENIKIFARMLEDIISKKVNISDFVSQTNIDAMCDLNDISYDLISEIGMLAPFGSGNPEPVLCVRNINVSSQSVVGNNHLRMRVSGSGVSYSSIWFNKGHLIHFLSEPSLDIAFTPHINIWNGASDIQLKMKDISFPTFNC